MKDNLQCATTYISILNNLFYNLPRQLPEKSELIDRFWTGKIGQLVLILRSSEISQRPMGRSFCVSVDKIRILRF